ncbi:MAG: hypothetical protein A2Y76_15025 [Planctomycetes bacterium RBG_13_60_9]|nr:MAG: hypothetical protein A2Y76_15025 [Planctomycetes bacterium RBG_13_60_9]
MMAVLLLTYVLDEHLAVIVAGPRLAVKPGCASAMFVITDGWFLHLRTPGGTAIFAEQKSLRRSR